MTRLAQTADLTDIQQEILSTVRTFVDKEIIPHAQELEHADEYPQEIVDGLKELGIFGLMIPASARPSPSSWVSRICRRATSPSTSPTGPNTNAITRARIARALVCRG